VQRVSVERTRSTGRTRQSGRASAATLRSLTNSSAGSRLPTGCCFSVHVGPCLPHASLGLSEARCYRPASLPVTRPTTTSCHSVLFSACEITVFSVLF